ncbi:MAG: T9SS type A sorting domain-containing protein [Bacteroidia bacterium]|nr:T9SS type A sorting domain-containing protein [Bacteroidia bacterium]
MKIKNFFFGLILINAFALSAQKDSLYPLNSNPSLFLKAGDVKNSTAKIASVTPLSLPFFDDFARPGIFPDSARWIDSNVFINTTYPRAPFTIGVATFDGLNKHGYPYNINAAVGSSAGADTLTSHTIDLYAGSPNDTEDVYFSFFYQTRGWGDAPETNDSLILEFFKPAQNAWARAWGKAGFNLGPNDSSWKYVVLHLTDTAYHYSDFKFRFRNRATISGALDHWHVDYVYLDNGRTLGDSSTFQDQAFGYEAPSLLRTYSSMPYWQFTNGADISSNFPLFIRNNDTTSAATNIDVFFKVLDNNGVQIQNSTGGSQNINNWILSGWDNFAPHCNMPITFGLPPNLTDTGTYTAKVKLDAKDSLPYDKKHYNDTLTGFTHFYNYYSYDDGTAEGGYGLNAIGAEMAVKITIGSQPDTIKALDVYFDPVVNVGTLVNATCTLYVWNDNGGFPGTVLYSDTSVTYPSYVSNLSINGFVRDTFDKAVPVLAGGTYYVGIKQTNNTPLNIGFDRNYNHQNKMFYNSSGSWNNASYAGSYMMRPVMSRIGEFSGISSPAVEPGRALVFPNPARDQVTINHTGIKIGQLVKAELYDLSGRMMLSQMITNNQSLDISEITNGIYFLRISDGKSLLHTTKLFIAH